MRPRSVPVAANFALVGQSVQLAPFPHSLDYLQRLPPRRADRPAARALLAAQQRRRELNRDGAVAHQDLDRVCTHSVILGSCSAESNGGTARTQRPIVAPMGRRQRPTAKVGELSHLGPDYPEHRIREGLYLLRPGGLASARSLG